MLDELKPCPCGKTPKKLCIEDGQSCKYAWACGDCCNEWSVEFRTHYWKLDSIKCMELANNAWNQAPRKNMEQED